MKDGDRELQNSGGMNLGIEEEVLLGKSRGGGVKKGRK